MTHLFGWDLPPGVTLNDIEEAMGGEREMSEEEAQRFDALMQEDVEHLRNGYGAEDPFLPEAVVQQSPVNQVQIGDTTTALFWHGSQNLTLFTPKEKVTLSQEETYRLLVFLQAEMRDSD